MVLVPVWLGLTLGFFLLLARLTWPFFNLPALTFPGFWQYVNTGLWFARLLDRL